MFPENGRRRGWIRFRIWSSFEKAPFRCRYSPFLLWRAPCCLPRIMRIMVSLISHQVMNLVQIVLDLRKELSRVGLQITLTKSRVSFRLSLVSLFLFALTDRISNNLSILVLLILPMVVRINSGRYAFAVSVEICNSRYVNINITFRLFRSKFWTKGWGVCVDLEEEAVDSSLCKKGPRLQC